MSTKRQRKSILPLIIFASLIAIIVFSLPASSQGPAGDRIIETPSDVVLSTAAPSSDEPISTAVPPTDIPPTDVPPTAVPPTNVPPADPTAVPQVPTEVPTEIPTEVPTIAPVEPDKGGVITPDLLETFCQMGITDANDENPFTYAFAANNSNNIASWAWDFDQNVNPGTNAVTQNANFTYPATGSYTVTLTCTPTAGFGAPFTLTGVINISVAVSASFYFSTGNEYEGLPPFTVPAVNTSTGGGTLTYVWRISGSNNPLDPGLFPDLTTTNVNPTLTGVDFVNAGFGPFGPAVLWYHMTATDPVSGLSATASQSVSFLPPAPLMDFDMTPTDGIVPLVVTFQEIDLGGGPVDTLNWTFQNGLPANATGPGPHVVSFSTVGVWNVTLNYSGPGGGGSRSRQVGVYNNAEPVNSLFSYQIIGGPVGAIQVCFDNLSTGPYVASEWDFESDGNPTTFDVMDNSPQVCYSYATGGSKTVQLRVRDQEHVDTGGATGSSSSSTQSFSLTASPIADFTFTPATPVVQGTQIDFTDTSDLTGGGPVTSWLWEINGVMFSTAENPQDIPFNTVGGQVIRLTVTGPGGTSFVEKIIVVTRLEIGCAFTGTLNVLPTSGPVTYTANISNVLGRPITYAWTVTGSGAGLPISGSSNTLTVDWAAVGYGAFQVTLVATTSDGSQCNVTQTVNRSWRPLDCQINNPTPSPLYPNGSNYTFTATVNNRNGRTVLGYDWYLNGSLVQSGASNTYIYANTNNSLIGSTPMSVRYVVIVDNNTAPTSGYVPATSTCEATRNFTISPWPDVVCNAASMSGDFSPIPLDDTDGSPVTDSYTVSPAGIAGRPVTYVWSVTGGTIISGQGTATVVVQWDPGIANETPPAAPQNGDISVVVTVTNPDGVTNANDTCTSAHTIGGGNGVAIQYQSLVCNAPTGDQAVVVGEWANHFISLSHLYGRPILSINWVLEQESSLGAGDWAVVPGTTDTTNPFDVYQFMTPDGSYRLSYSVTVGAGTLPNGDSCTSPYTLISTYGTGASFQCESVSISGNANPNNPAISYSYSVSVDNSTNLPLRYIWTLTDSDGIPYILRNFTSTLDGGIATTPALTLAELGPIGPGLYSLRVDVSDSSGTTSNTCNRTIGLTVGFVDANYGYVISGGWTNTALPINTQICLTNTSTHAPTAPASHPVQYTWTFGGTPAQNSLGATSFTTDNVPCFVFNTPGSYAIMVEIRNAAGTMIDTFSRTFTVYGLQAIVINRTAAYDDFSNVQSFTANGTNITGPYNWVFTRISDSAVIATRNNQQNPANVSSFAPPGFYRATVTGSGPLGNTSASLDFEILATNSLQARFTPSQWAGVAPMNVCFTDASVSGTPILTWEWDLDGNGSYETAGVGPHCYNYTVPGVAVSVSLRVTNAAFNDVATNTIRTYTPAEASQNFSITPYGGGAFCFTPILVNSTLVSWNYGDGTPTVGPLDPACHTYGSGGTFLVTMCFTSDIDGTPGCITRPVTVTTGPTPVPNLIGNATCDAGTAVFTVTNTGDGMVSPDQVQIVDGGGNVVLIAPLQLGSGSSANYTVNGVYGTVTLTATDLVLSVSTLCVEYTMDAPTCSGDLPVFTIRMVPIGAQDSTQAYTINPGGFSGSWTILASNPTGTTTVSVPGGSNPYISYTFTSNGGLGNLTSTSAPCAAQPDLTVTGICRTNPGTGEAEVGFTVTNNANPMVVPQGWTVNPGGYSGTIQLGANASTEILVSTSDDPYATYTFTSNGYADNVTLGHTCTRPNLQIVGSCNVGAEADVRFTVTNTGGNMLEPQAYTLTGGTVVNGTLQLASGASTTVSVNVNDNPYAPYTFTSNGFADNVTINFQCSQPSLNVATTCGSPLVLTVSNAGGTLLEPEPYTVRDNFNVVVSTGTIPTTLPFVITLPAGINPYVQYTLTTDVVVGTVGQATPCGQPQLTVVGACRTNAGTGQAEVVFTVTNSGPNMLDPQLYSISGGTPVNGSYQLNTGQSFEALVNSNDNPYGTYTFTSGGFAGNITVVNYSCQQPALTVTTVCGTPLQLIISNGGGALLESVPYTVTAVSGGATVASGTIDPSGANALPLTVTLPGGLDPYGTYVVSSAAVIGTIAQAAPCAEPQLAVVGICGVPRMFMVTNSGGDMLEPQAYDILRDAVSVMNGTLNLAAGIPEVITLPVGSDPYGIYTFTTSGFAADLSVDHDCAYPVLTATNVCAFPLVITVTNNGGTTLQDEPWTVVDSIGTVVASGSNPWTVGESIDITLTDLDPYAPYVFSTTGFPDLYDVDAMTPCEQPALTASYVCAATPSFILTNNGGDMLTPQQVTVTSGIEILIDEPVQLAAGGTQDYLLTGANPYDTFSLTTSGGFATEIEVPGYCGAPALTVEGICGTPAGFTVTNLGDPMPVSHGFRILSALNQSVLFAGGFQLGAGESTAINLPADIDTTDAVIFVSDDFGLSATATLVCENTVLRPTASFAGLTPEGGFLAPSCGRGCPVFKMYHTDELGGWEIFRLDSADEQTKTSVRENLSFGLDENVASMSPSLSPDNRWIVFASNRDGNWELYVAPTSGGGPESVERVTYNTIAIDSDPVWGPNNIVVFETTRHGNWDLYAVDMETGTEFRLTDSGGNDINPYWSADGSKLVFQSDRPDENGDRKWQVYELNLANLALSKLSDGTSIDVDPEYSNGSSKVAFRSYAAEGQNSQLSIMNADGSGRMVFSDPAGDATNAAWSPNDTYIAYQSDLDGDLDIYVFEVGTGLTRHLTDNAIADYAPTWLCDDIRVVWTSDIMGEPNIFEVNVPPITDGPLLVDPVADQMSFELSSDIYPLSSPSEENASREGNTLLGSFGTQTVFLEPLVSLTPVDLNNEGIVRTLWQPINACPANSLIGGGG